MIRAYRPGRPQVTEVRPRIGSLTAFRNDEKGAPPLDNVLRVGGERRLCPGSLTLFRDDEIGAGIFVVSQSWGRESAAAILAAVKFTGFHHAERPQPSPPLATG